MKTGNKIQFIVCKPISEYYYSYGINSAKKLKSIEKGELKALIRANIPLDVYFESCKLIDAFEFFMIDVEKEQNIEFDVDSESLPLSEISNLTNKNNEPSNTLLTKTNNFSKVFNGLLRKRKNGGFGK